MDLIAAGKFLKLVRQGHWEYATRPGGREVAVIVAVTADRRLLLVEQARIPLGCNVLELPAGLIGDHAAYADEAASDAAQRELEEETGYRAGRLTELMRCPTSAGLTDETAVFFRAEALMKVGPGGGDPSEQITVHAVPLAGIDRWLLDRQSQGVALDPKIYTALYWLDHPPDASGPFS